MSGDERSLKDAKITHEQPPRPDSSSSSVISRTSSPEHVEGDVFASVGKQQDQLDPENISADVAARGIVSPKKPLGTLAQTGMRGMLTAACEVTTDESEKSQRAEEVTSQGIKSENLDNKAATSSIGDHDREAHDILSFNKDSSNSRPSSASSSSSTAEGAEKRGVAFQAVEKERSFISHASNTTVEVISTCTQTEWSWLKDMELFQEISNKSKPEWANKTERKMSSPSGNYVKTEHAHKLIYLIATQNNISLHCSFHFLSLWGWGWKHEGCKKYGETKVHNENRVVKNSWKKSTPKFGQLLYRAFPYINFFIKQ